MRFSSIVEFEFGFMFFCIVHSHYVTFVVILSIVQFDFLICGYSFWCFAFYTESLLPPIYKGGFKRNALVGTQSLRDCLLLKHSNFMKKTFIVNLFALYVEICEVLWFRLWTFFSLTKFGLFFHKRHINS